MQVAKKNGSQMHQAASCSIIITFFPVLSDFVSREGRMKMSSSFQMSLVIADFGFLCKP